MQRTVVESAYGMTQIRWRHVLWVLEPVEIDHSLRIHELVMDVNLVAVSFNSRRQARCCPGTDVARRAAAQSRVLSKPIEVCVRCFSGWCQLEMRIFDASGFREKHFWVPRTDDAGIPLG